MTKTKSTNKKNINNKKLQRIVLLNNNVLVLLYGEDTRKISI